MEKPKPIEGSEKQSIEQLQRRYNDLNNKKIRADADLDNAKKELERLKKEARQKYQTDDVAKLEKLLAQMKSDNEEKRKAYQTQLDTIESELAEVEKKFAPDTTPPSVKPPEE
jgi:chromosome segregation ATPase